MVEDGSLLNEGDEVIIEKIAPAFEVDEAAFSDLRAKLQNASANADDGNFLLPHEVRAEIHDLRKNYKAGTK